MTVIAWLVFRFASRRRCRGPTKEDEFQFYGAMAVTFPRRWVLGYRTNYPFLWNNPMTQFLPGQILATPAALDLIDDSTHTVHELLDRHLAGDWGAIANSDAHANERALKDGSRILSSYDIGGGDRVWIITEAEDPMGRRAATTIILPSEY